MSDWIHYSSKPLEAVYGVTQRDSESGRGAKPRGLWFSVGEGDDGWLSWCRAESFMLNNWKHRTQVVPATNAKILTLSSADEIDALTATYGCTPEWRRTHPRWIDWATVAEQYDGIVIAPYCWERRFTDHAGWYYGWDVASGCVWNPCAIAELRPLAPVETQTEAA